MRFAILGAVLALLPAVASAQYYNPYARQRPAAPYTTYDTQSGNRYTVTPQYGGGAQVRGYNAYNGSSWNTTIQPNGNQRGMDANGNYWNYNASSGTYYNYGTGTTCAGRGRTRSCF